MTGNLRDPLVLGFRALGRMSEDSLIAQDAAADIDDDDLSRAIADARSAVVRAGNRIAYLRREMLTEGEAA